jgi:hypothetical protein
LSPEPLIRYSASDMDDSYRADQKKLIQALMFTISALRFLELYQAAEAEGVLREIHSRLFGWPNQIDLFPDFLRT